MAGAWEREREHVDAVIVCAMAQEAQPFLDRAAAGGADDAREGRAEPASTPAVTYAGAAFSRLTIEAPSGLAEERLEVLLVRSGIGLVNAAMAATRALTMVDTAVLVSAGTAGGLAGVRVGDVAVGTLYSYSVADATAFGYAMGQIPGMPEVYDAAPRLLAPARTAAEALGHGGFIPAERGGSPVPQVVLGPIVSGDTFVAGDLLAQVQGRWPDAVATDMESTALAQVAHAHGVDFISVRGISDLCGPVADDDFTLNAGEVAARSCERVLAILTSL